MALALRACVPGCPLICLSVCLLTRLSLALDRAVIILCLTLTLTLTRAVIILCGVLFMAMPITIVGNSFAQVWEEKEAIKVVLKMQELLLMRDLQARPQWRWQWQWQWQWQ